MRDHGEQPSLRTYRSRGPVRPVALAGVVAALAGLALVLAGGPSTPAVMLLACGAVLAAGCGLVLLDARRHPAPPTAPPDHAGPREAGW
jgi:drug/metabolite transporter (DMT)-like permease